MKASVEISMYPLDKDYERPILAFIERLRANPEVKIKVTGMSTQVFGEYDQVMSIIQTEMKRSFSEEDSTVVFAMKVLNVDAQRN